MHLKTQKFWKIQFINILGNRFMYSACLEVYLRIYTIGIYNLYFKLKAFL